MTMNRKGLLVIINIFLINIVLFLNLLIATTGSQVSLLLSHDTIAPGKIVTAYLDIQLEPGWYTYWQNPGKIGSPLSLAWQLPPNISAKKIHWPTPTLIQNNGYLSYGHKDRLLVTIPLIVSDNPTDKSPLPIKLTANWLECKSDICVPKTKTLTTTIKISKTNKQNLNSKFLNDYWEQMVPIQYDRPAEYITKNKKLWIKLPYMIPKTVKEIYLFSVTNHYILHPINHIKDQSSQSYLVSPDIETTPAPFTGIIKFVFDDHWESALIQFQNNPQLDIPIQPIWHVLKILCFALIGGLILNVMPCVFPILSLKLLTLTQKPPQKAKQHAIAYTFGVIISLITLWSLLTGLKLIGYQLGWGFHLQSPVFILLLIWLFCLITLYLLDWISLPEKFYTSISQLETKSYTLQAQTWGLQKSFLTGILTTITATPCTAPFMTTAISAAFISTPFLGIFIFIFLGLGIASPFLILSCFPQLYQYLPKPGQWMNTLKKWLALPIGLTVIWLLWVLFQQISFTILNWSIASIIHIVILCRLFKKYALTVKTKWILIIITFIGFSLIISRLVLQPQLPISKTIPHFKQNMIDVPLKEKQRLFINVTAKWCITCQVNQQTTLGTDQITDFFQRHNITVITADWTNYNPEITQYLNEFNRTGIPFYVFYNANGEPLQLPQLLTPQKTIKTIKQHFIQK